MKTNLFQLLYQAWNSKSAQKTNDELKKLIELRSQNDMDLHVEQVSKKGNFNKWLVVI